MPIRWIGDVDLDLFHGEIGQIALLYVDRLRGRLTGVGERRETGGASRGHGGEKILSRHGIAQHPFAFLVEHVSPLNTVSDTCSAPRESPACPLHRAPEA